VIDLLPCVASNTRNLFQKITSTSEGVIYSKGQKVVGAHPPLFLCTKMCSRPCLRKPTRYKKGETDNPVPPTISYYLQLLPNPTAPLCSVSKSRGRKVMRVRPPHPAPPSFARSPQKPMVPTISCRVARAHIQKRTRIAMQPSQREVALIAKVTNSMQFAPSALSAIMCGDLGTVAA
jgi:hypothetical protein